MAAEIAVEVVYALPAEQVLVRLQLAPGGYGGTGASTIGLAATLPTSIAQGRCIRKTRGAGCAAKRRRPGRDLPRADGRSEGCAPPPCENKKLNKNKYLVYKLVFAVFCGLALGHRLFTLEIGFFVRHTLAGLWIGAVIALAILHCLYIALRRLAGTLTLFVVGGFFGF